MTELAGPRQRVFIPQEPTRWDASERIMVPMMSFRSATEYGDLVVCLPHNISFHMTEPITASLREKMADFNERDYLIAVGAPELMIIASNIALKRTGGRLNLLTWLKRERTYVLKTLTL